MRLHARLNEFVSGPFVTRWSWALALLFALPALALDYVMDDLQQQSMLLGTYDSAARSGGELYCFSPGPGRGIEPSILSWWDDAHSSLCFLRPISSWTLWIDHAWLWRWPALPHLHSVLWFMGLWLAWRAILRRYLPAPTANLALLLTAASGAIAMTTAWVASRHALVGGCFGSWGLYHCLRSRDERVWSKRELLGWLLIGLGLLSSEMVLGVFGFLVAREWLAQPRRRDALARIAAYAVVGVAYVAVHGKLGYGAPKYALYLNPSSDPATFLREAPARLLALTGDLVLGVPSDAWVYPSLAPLLAALASFAGAMACIAIAKVLRDPSAAALRWLGLGALLCLAPGVSGMQGGRVLTIAGFGLFALIAACLLQPATNRVGALALTTLALGAFVGNPAAHLGWYVVLDQLDHAGEKGFDTQQVACPSSADVYIIDASELGATAWYARYWLKDKLSANNYRQLTMCPLGAKSIEVVRTGADRLTLRSTGGPLVGEMAIPPGEEGQIQAGFERHYPDYSVRVKEVSARGPSEVEFQFSRALDAPELCIFVQDDTRLYQLKPPQIGHSSVIRFASTLQGLSDWIKSVCRANSLCAGCA